MSISELTLLRRRIGDNAKSETESFDLTGGVTSIELKYDNPAILNLYDVHRQSGPLSSGTDYSLDGSTITLLYTPEDGSMLTVVYTYSAFSDDELNELITEYGLNTAVLEAIRWLQADSAKLHSYSRGATSESLDQVFKQLGELYEQYSAVGGLDTDDSSDVTMLRRTNKYYRTKPTVISDLSREDI